MARLKPTKKTTVADLEVEIERALAPGHFVDWREGYAFIRRLEQVEETISGLVDASPDCAADLYETFLAGCFEKAEEIDDSSDYLGMFITELFKGWVLARKSEAANPEETALRLLKWMDDDPYGYTDGMEKDICGVFSKKGRDAFAAVIKSRFEEHANAPRPFVRQKWANVLKTIYATSKNISAYVGVCEDTEYLTSDCETIARILQSQKKYEQALEWVEKGLEIDRQPSIRRTWHNLETLQRELLTRVGRGDEALESAWHKFEAYPSEYSYEELMKYVPADKRKKWHARTLDVIATTELRHALTLLRVMSEDARILSRIENASDAELESISHTVIEPLANRFRDSNPQIAGRLFCAMGMRIVEAGKSKYYDAALSNFEDAGNCWKQANCPRLWEAVVTRVRVNHKRKYSFYPYFEEIVAGKKIVQEPSFLERAKSRWKDS
ncbi:MAG: hypothetical protein JXX14_26575 [Deltaproteobacteria bacterium]|nr:hypothetical protein [Deltaproteobacteria bacterium]